MTIAQSLIAFVLAAGLITVTPGLDTALVLRAAAAEGRRSGGWAAVGVSAGCLVWGGAVALGLTALLAASTMAYTVLRWIGAAYLLYLGVGLLLRPRSALQIEAAPSAAGHPFRRGLLTNLLNPKVGIFYVSFLPQFIPTGANAPAWSFLLAAIHVALGLAWFALLIGAIDRARRWLARSGVVKTLDRITGCVFVGFGLNLALSRRA
ncbi:MAG: LysE family translocator [Caulobacteraceae bacterium]|nr:LysE family translocator [Caulobacteraceae bacterium]